ncbi:MAG: fumarylacetoacetate hydrolase family protein [Roseiflexaceae bacterium]|jgi:2-dehydro-3-deoxy-D-arabinonate dehydratase|nr:fumarylacetoacetate hydrolase family protein [Chloroflexaceae bacterium]
MYICRFTDGNQHVRIGFVVDEQVYDITARFPSITAFLRWTIGRTDAGSALRQALHGVAPVASLASVTLLRPSDDQEIWAAGVTYERSRVAREEESAKSGIYDRVYTAPRPEIFFKATPSRVVGPGEAVAIREDASWNVPEPELALVINPALEIVGYTIGNDMSSRDIEGENPLYLPQAKMYGRCCAIGPMIALSEAIPDAKNLTIEVTIERAGRTMFSGQVSTSKIVRRYEDLVSYLGRDNLFPDGVLLLTGTGIVPGDDFTLESRDTVRIRIDGIGTLQNPVVRGGVA